MLPCDLPETVKECEDRVQAAHIALAAALVKATYQCDPVYDRAIDLCRALNVYFEATECGR